jgi:hypothetical protein
MEYLVKNIDQFVDDNRRKSDSRSRSKLKIFLSSCVPCIGRFLGNYIVILYLIVKVVYILNTSIQIWLISGLLGNSFLYFGLNFLKQILNGHGWSVSVSEYFPRVVLCDFLIREIGNQNKSHRYTVQCVLPINLFNQQIFTVIWFWYFIVLVCNLIGLIAWIQKMYSKEISFLLFFFKYFLSKCCLNIKVFQPKQICGLLDGSICLTKMLKKNYSLKDSITF